jgi:hypothetical protein
MKTEFEHLSAKFAKAYQDVDPKLVELEIEEAIQSIRKKENRGESTEKKKS